VLQPSNRLTLIDAMRPPSGYQIDSAMAVTYTLDLRALLAAPAAFALGAHSSGEVQAIDEPIELLHAVRRYAGRITVFNQFDSIALAPSRKVFTFVEGSIVPVRAPRGGVVHPKVWVLRYMPQEGAKETPMHRVLIASRNLTFDDSWDTLVRFDETTAGGEVCLAGVADLFDGLSTNALRPISDVEQQRVNELGAALRNSRFAVPAGVDTVRVHTLGFDSSASPLPAASDRSLVISPFLSDDFFTSIASGPVGILVSRPEAIDGLTETVREGIGELLTLDDGSVAESPDNGEPDRQNIRGPGQPLRGLHAKVFAFESRERAQLFLGSANATGAAFRNNVEVLVEFGGTTQRLGIENLIDGNDDEPGLRRLLATYVPSDARDDDDSSDELDQLRHDIALLNFHGEVEASGDGWSVTYRTSEPLPSLTDCSVRCWPLTTPANEREITGATPLNERFDTTLESISGLLAFQIERDGVTSGFVVPVPLHGVPDERDRALLASLIGNAERFFRYLLALLDDDMSLTNDTRERLEQLGADDNEDPITGLPVLERLLKTRRTDPTKLLSLHPLVTDLAADGVLPDGFGELWDMLIIDLLNPEGTAF